MTFTQQERKQCVSLLRRARKSYDSKTYEGLCFHIHHAANNAKQRDLAYGITRLIRQRLGWCVYYPQWLRRYHPELLDSVSWQEKDQKIKQARLAWFDDLIREFSE